MTKSEILEFINNYFLDMSGKTYELSAMLDELIESAPDKKAIIQDGMNHDTHNAFHGYNKHCQDVSQWKKEAGK